MFVIMLNHTFCIAVSAALAQTAGDSHVFKNEALVTRALRRSGV